MQSKDRIIVQKIISYINEIKEYVGDMKAEEFLEDKKTITACAFTVTQIAELSNDMSDEIQTKYQEIPWHAIRGMRNRIVHNYENVDLSVLWATIEKSLPELKLKLQNILIENPEEII